MVNGVVSLRCPACARPFISLQQQPGTLITCPHCARSAAWETYPSAAESGQRAVTALPIQRRVIPVRPGFLSQIPVPVHQATLQNRPPVFSAPAAAVPAWPMAPEQAPMFAPSPSLFPPAPASPVWQPAPVTPPSPFGVAQAPLFQPQASVEIPGAEAETPPRAYEDATGSLQASAVDGLPSWQPPRDERNVPLGVFFVLVLAFAGWMLWENNRSPMAAEFKAPQPVSLKPETDALSSPSPPAEAIGTKTEPKVEPQPEIRRAELLSPPGPAAMTDKEPNLLTANEAAERLFKALLDPRSPVKRAEIIAQPEDNRADMEGFFERNKIRFKNIQMAEAQPVTIPGHEIVPLFQVFTDKNRQGAWLKLVLQGNAFLLDWPLFAETHERRLADYIEKKQDQPAWFHTVLRRAHALELAETVRSQHLCVELLASVDDSAQSLAVVPEDTPLGRFFERELDWGTVYLARLLLQNRKLVDGTRGVVILDCEGVVTGTVLPPGIR